MFLTPKTLAACDPPIFCRTVHEEVHKKEALAEDPNICRGKGPGTQVWNYPGGMKKSELRAYDAEIACVRCVALQFDMWCGESPEDYIKKLQNDRRQYE